MNNEKMAFPNSCTRCFTWKRHFQTIGRVALLGNGVSKQLDALFYLETAFPSICTRFFVWKRCVAVNGPVGGQDMHPSGVQFGLSRGLLQLRGEEVLLSDELLEDLCRGSGASRARPASDPRQFPGGYHRPRRPGRAAKSAARPPGRDGSLFRAPQPHDVLHALRRRRTCPAGT